MDRIVGFDPIDEGSNPSRNTKVFQAPLRVTSYALINAEGSVGVVAAHLVVYQLVGVRFPYGAHGVSQVRILASALYCVHSSWCSVVVSTP